jgi:hypothetical protein
VTDLQPLPEQVANTAEALLDHPDRPELLTWWPTRDRVAAAPVPDPDDELGWLHALLADLDHQRHVIREPREYLAGRHRLRFATDKFRETYGSLFGYTVDNWCRLVINAVVERLQVNGVAMNATRAGSDDPAWGLWQRSFLDADQGIAHTDAMVCRRSFLLVTRDAQGRGRISVEDPACVTVRVAPEDRRRRLAGLKHVTASDGSEIAWVHLPGRVAVFRRAPKAKEWERQDALSGPVRGADGEVLVVPMVNQPDAAGDGWSDLTEVIPTQDNINKLGIDAMVGSEASVYTWKAIMGWEPGPGDHLAEGPGVVNAFKDADTKLQEFRPADLAGVLSARAAQIESLSARTRTPPHYLLGQMVNVSGDALKAAETGLVAKVRERQRWFGEAWEEALRLGLQLEGRDMAGAERAEVLWANPESRSEVQLADALVKLAEVGFPIERLMKIYGLSPEEIREDVALRGLPRRPVGATADTTPDQQ